MCRAENLAGNVVHKFRLSVKDIYGSIISNEFVSEAVQAAEADVNKQFANSLHSLYDKRRPRTMSDLISLVRFPKTPSLKNLIASEEIYERALDIIFRYANNITFNLTQQEFVTEEVLTHQQLQRVSDLSGCHRHKRRVDCSDRSTNYRSFDGTCNNLEKPHKGAANTALKRLLPAVYENGFSTPRGWTKDRVYNG